MSLRLFTSNRLEILAKELGNLLQTPLPSPFEKEVILVQSKGMERWVSMQLAEQHGICANCSFPFPNHFVQGLFTKVLPAPPETSLFNPEIMTWHIMNLLPSLINMPEFEAIRSYLGGFSGDLKLLQLSERISNTFDQYLIFRPEMILRWEKGEEAHWQALLWRELAKGHETEHRVALRREFFKTISLPRTEIEGLPKRVSVFGISALPRFHIEVLAAISPFTQVNLFLMNPCREYWADIVSERELKSRMPRTEGPDFTPEELHLEKGNSLLASMGALGREFMNLVNRFEWEEFDNFQEPGEKKILYSLQSDILNLKDRPRIRDEKRIISDDDTSLQIHSCHGPMREMEVLHDRLLHMFEMDPGLLPKDILVMTPDIESYSTYIQAVFDLPLDDKRRIPFSIADRSIRKESGVIVPFMAILDLWGSRFGVSHVLAILESGSVRQRFGLLESDLQRIRRWLKDVRIRWGIDGETRAQLGLPPFEENTWKAGLERLLLGYAMPGRNEKLFHGILPYDHIEGSDTTLLGEFIEFTDRLFTHVRTLGQRRTLGAWSAILMGQLDLFFMPDDDRSREIQALRRTLNDLGNLEEASGFHEKVDLNTIKWHLEHHLKREGFGLGFITGGITFCALLPMRSIPFKVVCLVGMNSDTYPRQSHPVEFDLIAQHPKPGDRSRRNDDRYLFLEALLSSRETLLISYVGQSIQDNSSIPPSLLVSELLDYAGQGFQVVKHPVQAFSPEYFKKDEKRFSYSEESYRIAQRLLKERKRVVPFISRGLSEPEEGWRTLDLEDLCRFFTNPTRFLLQRRLGIHLEERTPVLEEREAFGLNGLDRYLLEEGLLEKRFKGRELRDLSNLVRASSRLPHGTVGEYLYDSMSRDIEHFVEAAEPYMHGSPLEPLEVDLGLEGFRLTGRVKRIYPERLIHYRYARIGSKDHLRAWIHHLVLNLIRADGYPRVSMLAGLDPDNRKDPDWRAWEYLPLEKSEEILLELLEKYRTGLIMPLHFFPGSSLKYAEYLRRKDKPEEDALRNARKTWRGGDYHYGECQDLYYQLCFGDRDPLDSEFRRIALEVFEPLLQYQKGLSR